MGWRGLSDLWKNTLKLLVLIIILTSTVLQVLHFGFGMGCIAIRSGGLCKREEEVLLNLFIYLSHNILTGWLAQFNIANNKQAHRQILMYKHQVLGGKKMRLRLITDIKTLIF